MTELNYPAKDAALTLQKAGLLSAVLVPGKGGLVSCRPSELTDSVGGFRGAGLDSRNLQPGELFVALVGETADGRDFIPPVLDQGHWVLSSPLSNATTRFCPDHADQFSGGVLVSSDPVAALAILAAKWRSGKSAQVVGITGTNGKTTTKDMLAAMLGRKGKTLATRGNLNNHLGLPLTLLQLRTQHRFAVLEMGASAVGEIDFLAGLAAPQVGIITNAAEAHLAEFKSLAGIIKGKGELLDHLPVSGLAILNADSPGFAQWSQRARCPVVSFGKDQGDHRWVQKSSQGKQSEVVLDGVTFAVPLPGQHNCANLVAAVLGARSLGLSDQEIRSGLVDFQGSPHRGVLLELGQRQIVDDCYNANPRSVVAAVISLLQMSSALESTAVLGHMAELGENSPTIHRETGGRLAALGLKKLVVVGTEARPMLAGFDAAGGSGHYCSSLAEAAAHVARNTSAGDFILIKGSRSAAMESILPHLAKQLAQP